MSTIIRQLLTINQLLISCISQLLFFIHQYIKLPDDDLNEPAAYYNSITVDKKPIIIVDKKLNYKTLLKEHKALKKKLLKPVNHNKGKPVAKNQTCPRCDAPHKYLYDNNGGRGQIKCKVCSFPFNSVKRIFNAITYRCPYCNSKLTKCKERTDFNVHVCENKKCAFYLTNKKALTPDEFEIYKAHSERFKLRYRYREFTTNFFKMDLLSLPKNACNLNFRKFSPHILGLVLTYSVNCNLSSRNTAKALREIHGVSISHTHVRNYANTAASVIKCFVDTYDYKPSKHLVADETYVKIKGVKGYIWFVMDACKKSILGYKLSQTRSLSPCIQAMRSAFDKYTKFPQNLLKFVADGYPVYKLAQSQFEEKDDKVFDLVQVIGLTNEDPVSEEYRWMKQIVERLNRTFKYHYRITTGYGTKDGGDVNLALFVAYYNFLRPDAHNSTRTINTIPELDSIELMPNKWIKLIELSQLKILSLQALE